VNAGLLVDDFIRQSADGVDIVQRVQFFQLHILEHIQSLRAQGITVHKKQDATETPAFQKAVHHPEHRPGLARTRGHGQQRRLCAAFHSPFHRLNGAKLIFPQIEAVLIAKKVGGQLFKTLISLGYIALQKLFHASGTHPSVQRPGSTGRCTHILKPDAGFLLILPDIGSAVGCKDKGYTEAAPLSDGIGQMILADMAGIVLALMVEHGGDILMNGLGFNDAHKTRPHKQGIVGKSLVAHG